ncbi:putative acyl- n-acyltransferase protein [Rosellinia necatrix]|uniref:Putative acyl-n-acyltransferase protein n=1 Tax=Rosellinia necatrix TaxID=77044 RepID=A0A1W2TKT6_ROSNE|nr:putative acyl- n-acyltransferase protein [Rosellinia necatrix]
MRPLARSDLTAFHRLRRQPEFMKHTFNGVPDADLCETRDKLDSMLGAPGHPNQLPFYTYFGIFLRATGELIGDGGVHTMASPACGWPEIGCKFGREHCGKGYGTEFLDAFTAWWWGLPRHRDDGKMPVQVRLLVHPDSVVYGSDAGSHGGAAPADAGRRAIEQLYAWIAPDNHASQGIATKAGFEHFVTWKHPSKKMAVLGWRQSRHRRPVFRPRL